MTAALALKPEDIAWQPIGRAQALFLSCPYWELLGEGDRGGGKTETLLMDFCQHVGQGFGPYWRGVLFRREYKHLDDVVVKAKRLFPVIFPEARWLSSKSDYRWVWPTGEELLLRAMSDPFQYWNYHGHEYPWLGWEELTNWPDDECYTIMASTNRSSGPAHMPRKVRATCNPWGVGHHWVKERFIDPAPRGQVINADKPGEERVALRLPRAENAALLDSDPHYVQRLRPSNEAMRKAWLDGSWDIAVGGFLMDVWDPNVHQVKPFKIPADWKRWRAMDWGFARPYSIGWYAMNPDGVIYRYRELYGYGGKANVGTRQTAAQVAAEVIKLEAVERRMGITFSRNPADSNIWHSDGTEQTVAELFSREQRVELDNGRKVSDRVRWVPASKGPGSRVATAQLVITALQERRLKVFNTCRHFLRTVPVLMPDEDNPEDVDTEQEDHAWDELRYSIASRHAPKPKKPPRTGPRPGSFDALVAGMPTPPRHRR